MFKLKVIKFEEFTLSFINNHVVSTSILWNIEGKVSFKFGFSLLCSIGDVLLILNKLQVVADSCKITTYVRLSKKIQKM